MPIIETNIKLQPGQVTLEEIVERMVNLNGNVSITSAAKDEYLAQFPKTSRLSRKEEAFLGTVDSDIEFLIFKYRANIPDISGLRVIAGNELPMDYGCGFGSYDNQIEDDSATSFEPVHRVTFNVGDSKWEVILTEYSPNDEYVYYAVVSIKKNGRIEKFFDAEQFANDVVMDDRFDYGLVSAEKAEEIPADLRCAKNDKNIMPIIAAAMARLKMFP